VRASSSAFFTLVCRATPKCAAHDRSRKRAGGRLVGRSDAFFGIPIPRLPSPARRPGGLPHGLADAAGGNGLATLPADEFTAFARPARRLPRYPDPPARSRRRRGGGCPRSP